MAKEVYNLLTDDEEEQPVQQVPAQQAQSPPRAQQVADEDLRRRMGLRRQFTHSFTPRQQGASQQPQHQGRMPQLPSQAVGKRDAAMVAQSPVPTPVAPTSASPAVRPALHAGHASNQTPSRAAMHAPTQAQAPGAPAPMCRRMDPTPGGVAGPDDHAAGIDEPPRKRLRTLLNVPYAAQTANGTPPAMVPAGQQQQQPQPPALRSPTSHLDRSVSSTAPSSDSGQQQVTAGTPAARPQGAPAGRPNRGDTPRSPAAGPERDPMRRPPVAASEPAGRSGAAAVAGNPQHGHDDNDVAVLDGAHEPTGRGRNAGARPAAGNAGDAPGQPHERREERRQRNRQEALQRLNQQEQQLEAGRDKLAAVDETLEFLTVLTCANDTLHKIEYPLEAARDAAQFGMLATCVLEAGAKLANKDLAQREPRHLISALRALYPPDDPSQGGVNWQLLKTAGFRGGSPQLAFRLPRAPTTMFGPMDVQPRVRAAPKRAPREKPAEKQRAEEVVFGDGTAHQADSFTNHLMDEMLRKLRNLLRVAAAGAAAAGASPALPGWRSWREVVLDHAGFAQTFENTLALSHLAAGGVVRMRVDDEGGLMVKALSEREVAAEKRCLMQGHRAMPRRDGGTGAAGSSQGGADGGGSAGGSRAVDGLRSQGGGGGGGGSQVQAPPWLFTQFIMSLDVGDWEEMKGFTPADQCLMDSRPDNEA